MTPRAVLALLGLAAAFAADAQQAEQSPQPVSSAPQAGKFQIIDQGEANQRCVSEALLKCLKISRQECETVSNAAAETANAEIEKSTDGRALSAFDAGFYQGQAMATFMMEMQKSTGNRFIKCVQKR